MPMLRLCLPLILLLMAFPAVAGTLPMPEGPVILEVSGDIANTNVGDEAHFDYAMLSDLGMHEVVTHTPWTQGVSRFEGPLARDLLDAVGAQGDDLTVTGLDGYVAEVPASDFRKHDVILALKRDGERIPIRERGPIFVLYPFDQKPELVTERIRFRSLWQVASILVE
ncbi:MAG: molybdopterin-dependent oxidoreductase [Halomonas sp.]|nr:molybdopterin-dependent oxidoreductase [Halomonas sp.]